MTLRAIQLHLLSLALFGIVLVPALVIGQSNPFTGPIVSCGDPGQPQCNFCHLATLIQNIINFGVYISMFAGGAMFSYAGWLYLMNNGDQTKVSRAHTIFKQVFVGLIIVLSAWLLIDIIMKSLLGGGYMPWNKICGA
jgi:hypothetical protein